MDIHKAQVPQICTQVQSIHPSIHPFSSAYPGPGRGGSRLSRAPPGFLLHQPRSLVPPGGSRGVPRPDEIYNILLQTLHQSVCPSPAPFNVQYYLTTYCALSSVLLSSVLRAILILVSNIMCNPLSCAILLFLLLLLSCLKILSITLPLISSCAIFLLSCPIIFHFIYATLFSPSEYLILPTYLYILTVN